MRETAVHLMFLASGAASLICQVIWFKQLQFVLGSSTYAVSVTVASFFFGLSAGSWLGGRWSDRLTHPLRAYGLLEMSLSLASLAVTLLLSRWSLWATGLAPLLGDQSLLARAFTLGVAFATLLAPTMLMGATLPLLSKYIVREQQSLARRIGWLYGLNTLGAAIGCALVGFVLIGALGVLQSALVGSSIYVAIGLAAGWLSLSAQPTERSAAPVPVASAASAVAPSPANRQAVTVLIAVVATSGFVSIAYEVLWFRILANFSLHTVYAFSAMLTTYLLGLVLGAFLCAKLLAPRKAHLLSYFAKLQLLIAIAGMVTLALLGRSRNILQAVAPIPAQLGLPPALLDALANTTEIVVLCAVVLLVPTTLIGIGFPLATELTIHHLSIVGRRVGALYALNTLGGTLGSLVAGFVLLPYLGSQTALTIIVGLNIVLFGLTVASQPSLRGDRRLWRQGGETVVFVCVAVWVLGPNYLASAQTRFEGGEVLAFEETSEATFIVMGYESATAGRYQQLLVNGRSYANNAPPGRRYMAVLGHLPALLHPDPQSALVACIGTGTTVGALTAHPSLERIRAVDLAEAVFDLAPFFEPLNHRFDQSPRVEQVVADARHDLLTYQQRFDLITFEPPPPHDAGVVNLYTREFYQLAKRRLEPDGVVVQWVPLDMPRQVLPRMMIRTMLAEFPHVSLWIPNRMEGILVGSAAPLEIDLERWAARLQHPALHRDLSSIGLGSAEDLAAMFVAADDRLAALAGDVPIVTDDHPRIEYFNFYPTDPLTYDAIVAHREPVEPYLVAPPPNAEALEAARVVATAIWREHEASALGRGGEAHALLNQALRHDPENLYLRYLNAELSLRWPELAAVTNRRRPPHPDPVLEH